jgi:hypothetical protein
VAARPVTKPRLDNREALTAALDDLPPANSTSAAADPAAEPARGEVEPDSGSQARIQVSTGPQFCAAKHVDRNAKTAEAKFSN